MLYFILSIIYRVLSKKFTIQYVKAKQLKPEFNMRDKITRLVLDDDFKSICKMYDKVLPAYRAYPLYDALKYGKVSLADDIYNNLLKSHRLDSHEVMRSAIKSNNKSVLDFAQTLLQKEDSANEYVLAMMIVQCDAYLILPFVIHEYNLDTSDLSSILSEAIDSKSYCCCKILVKSGVEVNHIHISKALNDIEMLKILTRGSYSCDDYSFETDRLTSEMRSLGFVIE